jgi:hypothetical protein
LEGSVTGIVELKTVRREAEPQKVEGEPEQGMEQEVRGWVVVVVVVVVRVLAQ